ncbi:MAG: hypothetical protein EG828_09210 [Deltaproteobacteria bacterium]|nr:hypothetical protein [Deltaproteobacteria bacterium]
MIRIVSTAVISLILTACSTLEPQPAVVGLSADHTVVADLPSDYEIEDVRGLPQDFVRYAALTTNSPLDTVCRDFLFSEFRRKYYAPWSVSTPLSNIPGAVQAMQEHARKDWYGDNKRKVPRKTRDELLANCDLAGFPSRNAMAVAVVPTSMRVLPTERPFLVAPDDFPFDVLQNAGLKINEPLRVLHLSADGIWAFAETADANGWVPLRDIGFIQEGLAAEWSRKEQIVIVKDLTLIRDRQEQLAMRAKVGTIVPLSGESGESYEVSVAVKSADSGVREITVRVPKDSARRFPLTVDRETVALIGNQLIGKPYGWGELYQGNDCSSLLRDFYLPFGIWLPRGSYNQINSGKYISFTGLSTADKERFIREKGVPFLTILHMKGHILLYVGSEDDTVLVFHSLWGVKMKGRDGRKFKQAVGKAIISTLTPGSELINVDGSLLEKVSSMLILSDRCGLMRR